MSEWQPMATAPKNKKVLVGYRNSHGHWRNVTAIYYAEGALPMEETEREDDDEFAPPGWYETSETHDKIHATEHEPVRWQPLPPPPSDA